MSDFTFTVVGARAEPYAAVPTLMLRLRIEESTGAQIHMMSLRCQIQIEAKRRRYTGAEEARLFEQFGEPHRWGETLRSILWTHVPLMVGGFEEAIEIDVPIVCTYDLEVAPTGFLRSLDDGEIPVLLQFSGTVFTKGGNGFAVEQLSWTKEASYRLPVRLWRELLDRYFPGTGWIRLRRDTIDALQEFKGRRTLPTWDDVAAALLAESERVVEPAEQL